MDYYFWELLVCMVGYTNSSDRNLTLDRKVRRRHWRYWKNV